MDDNRFDAFVVDNMYVGYDRNYTNSAINLTASGNSAKAYTGALNVNNIYVTALFDDNGCIKNVKLGNVTAKALQNATIENALVIDGGESGDTVKFFIVNSLLNIMPISNVISKTIE